MSTIFDLNGKWDLIFDANNLGEDQRWYANPPAETKSVEIPHTWEQEFGKYPGSVAFYFRKFYVDPTMNSKRAFLRFRRSFFQTKVWVNGKLVGENAGGHHPFTFNLAKAIKPGDMNMICVRVSSESANRIEGTPIAELPVGLPFFENPFGGLWGDVELINGGKSCLLNLDILPDIDNQKIQVDMDFSNPRNYAAKLLFVVKGPAGEVSRLEKEVKLEKEDASHRISLGIKDPVMWSPDQPNLYTLEVYLDKSYKVSKYFGFRKFDVFRNEFFLNDTPTKLMGVVYNLSHPVAGGLPETGEALRSDLTQIKKSGFNVIRTGGSPLDDKTLDICDEIGLMVWQEMPIHKQRSTKEGLELSKTVITELVNQQKSHPSIVAWVLGSENGALMLENGTKLLKFVDDLDNSRPVFSNLNCVYLDNEGDFKKDTGKVLGVTNDRVQLYNSHRINTSMHMPKNLSAFCASYFQEDGTAAAVSDSTLGNGNMAEEYARLYRECPNHKVLVNLSVHTLIPEIKDILKKYGTAAKNYNHGKKLNTLHKALNAFFDKEFKDSRWKNAAEFVDALNESSLKATKDRINSFLSSTQVTGYFLDCWADTNAFFNGLMDEFRRSKGAESLMAECTKSNRLLLSSACRSPKAGLPLDLQLKLLNGSRLGEVDLGIYMHMDGVNHFEFESKFDTSASVFAFELPKITAPAKEGDWVFEAVLKKDGQILDILKETFRVYEGADRSAILEADGVLAVHPKTKADQIESAKVLVVDQAAALSKTIAEQLSKAVQNGAKLLLTNLTPEHFDAVQSWKWALPSNAELRNTTGARTSHFHYWHQSPFFMGLSEQPLADHYFAEVMPQYSIDFGDTKVNAHANSFGITENGELEVFQDLATWDVGAGQICVHQYQLFAEESAALSSLLLELAVAILKR